MYQLLSICLVLHPQYIDESIQQALRDKNLIDKMARMQSGDIDVCSRVLVEKYFHVVLILR